MAPSIARGLRRFIAADTGPIQERRIADPELGDDVVSLADAMEDGRAEGGFVEPERVPWSVDPELRLDARHDSRGGNGLEGELSPTSHTWPKGSQTRHMPVDSPRHLVVAHLLGRAVGAGVDGAPHEGIGVVDQDLDPDGRRLPAAAGVANPTVGSWRNKGAPSTSSPITVPRLHSSTAPSARSYQAAASPASSTASMSEMRVVIDSRH